MGLTMHAEPWAGLDNFIKGGRGQGMGAQLKLVSLCSGVKL